MDVSTEPISAESAGSGVARVVLPLLGLVLLVAAGLKAHQLATNSFTGNWLLGFRWFNALAVELELLLGFWLVSGLWRNAALIVSFVCFSIFAVVTAYLGLIGSGTCGCFGGINVSPWATFTFDLLVLAALVANRPRLRRLPPARNARARLAGFGTAAIIAAVLTALWMLSAPEPPPPGARPNARLAR